MQYIVMDLEWNQPLRYADTIKEPTFLTGEIIQIGAVKLDEHGNELSQFNERVAPQFYTELHPVVASVTKLVQSDLYKGADFNTAFDRFCDWCGEDFVFLVWGTEDLEMLRKNMIAYNIDTSCMPSWYNLQSIFASQITKDNKTYNLSAALKILNENEFDAHDALNDAKSTGLVCKYLDMKKGIVEYSDVLKKQDGILESYEFDEPYDDMVDALNDDYVVSFECPYCGEIVWGERWVRTTNTTMLISLAKCSDGNEFLIKLKFKGAPDGKLFVKRSTLTLTDSRRKNYDLLVKQQEVWNKYVTSAYDW